MGSARLAGPRPSNASAESSLSTRDRRWGSIGEAGSDCAITKPGIIPAKNTDDNSNLRIQLPISKPVLAEAKAKSRAAQHMVRQGGGRVCIGPREGLPAKFPALPPDDRPFIP